jgi:predicted Zn finger-like uncharacterized protein
MQITCPNCAARYNIDPGALGHGGRTVQCFRCGHKWFERTGVAPEAVAPAAKPAPDFIIRPQSQGAPALPAVSEGGGLPGWLKASLGIVILLGFVAATAWVLRDSLYPYVPEQMRQQLGLKAPTATAPPPPTVATTTPPPAGKAAPAAVELRVRNQAIKPLPNSERGVIVSGELFNGGAVEIPTPKLKVVFRNKEQKSIGERPLPVKMERLPAGGAAPVELSVDDPPVGADDILIELAQ